MPTLTLPRPHSAQARVLAEARRFNVLACGRRWGKSKLGEDRAVQDVIDQPVAWFSPTYKMMLEIWRDMVDVLKPITLRSSVQERRIENAAGGVLEFWSLDNPDAARGRKYARAIIDEAAMVPTLLDAWNLVIRSTLADLRGDAWFLSTPKGMNGFWQMYQWGLDPQQTEWACWQMPTAANPHIKPQEVEAMRRTMPERVFQQEILAVFLEDAGGVFRRVMDAATAVAQDTAQPGGVYIVGVDWGKHSDFTALAVLEAKTRQLVYLDRFNQIDYQVQVQRLVALCERFRPAGVVAERNSMGDPLIEWLQRQGLPVLPFITTNATKARAIDELALAFEQGTLRIINDPVLVAELQAYEMARLPSGMLRYSAPEGMHDDTVMALAIAYQGLMEAQAPSGTRQVVTDQQDVTISPY